MLHLALKTKHCINMHVHASSALDNCVTLTFDPRISASCRPTMDSVPIDSYVDSSVCFLSERGQTNLPRQTLTGRWSRECDWSPLINCYYNHDAIGGMLKFHSKIWHSTPCRTWLYSDWVKFFTFLCPGHQAKWFRASQWGRLGSRLWWWIVCRKKIVDFYSRTSMSSYCTAFSYRPVVESVSDDLADLYLEVPEEISIFRNALTNRSLSCYSDYLATVKRDMIINLFSYWIIFAVRRLAKRGICRRRVSVCVCVCHTPVLYQNG